MSIRYSGIRSVGGNMGPALTAGCLDQKDALYLARAVAEVESTLQEKKVCV